VEWTPNHAVVDVKGAHAGALVVYDMNYDASWRADGEPALEARGLVAKRLDAGDERVEFRYFPRTLPWSLPLAALTLLGCVWRPAWTRALGARWSVLRRRFLDRNRAA
jgi:hypothetical protein